MQKKHIVMIITAFILIAIIVAIIINAPKQKVQDPVAEQIQQQIIHEKEVAITKQLIAMDVSDPSHVINIKFIQTGLEKYFNDYGYYPKKLEDMIPLHLRVVPQFSTGENYLYAYYPKDKPTKYHLGARLGGHNPADEKSFSEDADLNSKKANYVGGFDGTDPVYDLVSGKK